MRTRLKRLGLAFMGLAAWAVLSGCRSTGANVPPVCTLVRNVGECPVYLRRAERPRPRPKEELWLPLPLLNGIIPIPLYTPGLWYRPRWVEVRRLDPAQEVVCDGAGAQHFYLAADEQYPSRGALWFMLNQDGLTIDARSDGREVRLGAQLRQTTAWSFNFWSFYDIIMLDAATPPLSWKSHVYDPPRPWYVGDVETGPE